MYRVLLVEDNKKIRDGMVEFFEKKDQIKLFTAVDGNDGLDKILNGEYDLFLLDIMMPGLDGFELCRIIRRRCGSPVVFLTGKVREADQLYGYELGADDYIVKPFSMYILYSKLLAILERSSADKPKNRTISSGKIELDPARLTVRCDGEELNLSGKEFALLRFFMENKGTAVTRKAIFDAVWGPDSDASERVVDNRIKNLRKQLKSEGERIHTVFRVGYRFE